jgi:hypothetical protein
MATVDRTGREREVLIHSLDELLKAKPFGASQASRPLCAAGLLRLAPSSRQPYLIACGLAHARAVDCVARVLWLGASSSRGHT